MEEVKNRSESPFPNRKGKSYSSDTFENGNRITEQAKPIKKNLRNKNKHQINGKEIEGLGNTEQDFCEEEQGTSNETDSNVDSDNIKHENESSKGNNIKNGTAQEVVQETNEEKKDASTFVGEVSKKEMFIETGEKENKEGVAEQPETIQEEVNVDEDNREEVTNIETESSAKKNTLVVCDSLPQSDSLFEKSDEKCNGNPNDISVEETNGFPQEPKHAEDCFTTTEVSQDGLNSSDVNLKEEASITDDCIHASPDTAIKDGHSTPNKITNFLGNWTYSVEQKQNPEISLSKKNEETGLNHPYLSKVSGRRGIKERLNSSATVFSSVKKEAKTPENLGVSLDDSFRVRTNPPRLNSAELNENPTLRKFKGKRCLNAGDEPEEEEDLYLSTLKRRKLDEKTQESGILGSMLWSPFKKKSVENENHLGTTESKLSRLLSPFWFWKKTTEGQKAK